MKEDCLVKVITHQEIEGEKEKLKVITHGNFQKSEDSFTLVYTEKEQDGTISTTTLTVKENFTVTVNRQGSIKTFMVIGKGKRNLSTHETPYGTFSMGITGEHISYAISDEGGSLNFSYLTDTDKQPLGKIEFDIAFKFKKHHKEDN